MPLLKLLRHHGPQRLQPPYAVGVDVALFVAPKDPIIPAVQTAQAIPVAPVTLAPAAPVFSVVEAAQVVP